MAGSLGLGVVLRDDSGRYGLHHAAGVDQGRDVGGRGTVCQGHTTCEGAVVGGVGETGEGEAGVSSQGGVREAGVSGGGGDQGQQHEELHSCGCGCG